MAILRRRAFDNEVAEIGNGGRICAESFHFGSSTMSQTDNFSKGNALGLDHFQWLAAVQHRFIKPPPRPYWKKQTSKNSHVD